MRNVRSVLWGLAIVLAGCGGGSGMNTPDGGPMVSAEEAACENLFTIDPAGGCATSSRAECLLSLTSMRDAEVTANDCRAEYDAFVECLSTLTACASGMQCPDQWGPLASCAGL
jgi:hypothetical protein